MSDLTVIRTRAKRTIPPAARAFRCLIALLMLAAVALLFVYATEFRMTEARIAASWLDPLIDGGARSHDTHFLVSLPGQELVAFNITMECSALLVISPLAVVTALMLMFTRIGWLRATAALTTSMVVTFVINQLRLGLITWTTQTWGLDFGYELGHRFIGSLIALFGFAAGFVIILWITLKPHRTSKTRRSLKPQGGL
jgi:exosortase/archaeosortase family protein